MSALTIDELKKELANHNVELPSGRLKKEDYVQLYEKNVLTNGSSVTYSDDESAEKTNANDVELVAATLKTLNDDELYQQLRSLGFNAGPIVPSSRKLYEKKFIELFKRTSNGEQSTTGEFSDHEEQPPVRKSVERSQTPVPSSSREPSVVRGATPARKSLSRDITPAPHRFSYIEEIPRGTKQRIIRPSPDVSDALQGYSGKWSPTKTIQKIQEKADKKKNSAWMVYVAIAVAILAMIVYGAYLHWIPTDPYELLEEEAKQKATGSN